MDETLLHKATGGDLKALARCISLIENSGDDENLLMFTPAPNVLVTGITGAPGAGKSTLVDHLVDLIVKEGKSVAVLCIDPSSPFHSGAILGDRIRMNRWYAVPGVYIRSLAGKGALGGLSPKAFEITDLLRASGFDHVIIETIGVGQNEVEISSLADTTVVVLVPESGDEVQAMKSGMMEIADIFAVNKSDRPGADEFVRHLKYMTAPSFSRTKNEIVIVKTSALKNEGTELLYAAIKTHFAQSSSPEKRALLYAKKIYDLIRRERMKDVSLAELEDDIRSEMNQHSFNLSAYLRKFST